MPIDINRWRDRLAVLAEKHGVPGASLAVLEGDEVAEAAYGVLNIRTGVEATPDSLFQIGSITKVWTATLVMQLVDEGLVDLDVPVVTYLPDFRVADAEVTRTVTTRHLLAHTSGIDGDLFLDTGRGDDCVERYVAACADLAQNHPLGATMSYCNSGYIVLGRLIEVLRGKTWDEVLRERLFGPLGLRTAGTLPEEALLHRAATGHITPPGGELTVTPMWGIFRSCGPAGLIHATAAETLAFAKLHLADGVAPDGTRVLSAESAQAMREPQVEVPDRWTLGSHWGLGWILMEWSGRPVYGHDGATLGQGAFMRIVPDAGVAVCLLANGGHARDLFVDLSNEILGELASVELPPRLEPAATPPAGIDLSRYAGRYARHGIELTLSVEGNGLKGVVRSTSELSEALGGEDPEPMQVLPVEGDVFVAKGPDDESWIPFVFFSLPDGSEYVHFGARANPKVSSSAD
ncbi:MAG TPA: serine hydrolase domain-containing protein [Mycobacteriales bacterium]|jgi:CubicO group peptidase (beta-lactamase class C family)|nr:serine hydrolase domain-containing protein [Mycobacteriales bacterium]